MYNSEPIQPNEWNVYSANLTYIPARCRKEAKASALEDGVPQPVGLALALLANISEDAAEELALSNH